MGTLLSRLIWVAAGALSVLIAAELVLRALPVSMGLYRTDQYDRWPLQSSEARLAYTYSSSWALRNAYRGVTNNYGHIAPFDFRKGDKPVIVIGDSYVESLMNDYADTLQAQLADKLGRRDSVYGLGVSGLSASDYLVLSSLARDEFAPVAAVFVISDGDIAESLLPSPGSRFIVLDAARPRLDYLPLRGESLAKRIRKVAGESSLYRYLQVNLRFSPADILGMFRPASAASQEVGTPPMGEVLDRQRRVADLFLGELPTALALPPECIVLLMDSDRYAIYKPAAASPRKDDPSTRLYVIERARALGIKVSDLDPVFRDRYARDRMKFDHWPNDRHWNRLGHAIAATEAYRLLSEPDAQGRAACLAGPGAAR